MKIATFCPPGMPGVNAALVNLASMVPNVAHSNVEIGFDADFVILGGWVDQYQLALPRIKGKKAVWFTSSLGQSGLSPQLCEYAYLRTILKLLDDGRLDYLFVGGRKIFHPLRHIKNVIHLPFPLDLRKYRQYETFHELNRVVFFTPKNLYKNVPNQLIALSLAQQLNSKLEVHVNGMQNSPFQIVRDCFPLTAKDYGWLPDDQYYPLLASAACSLQVTYAEVCNYTAMIGMALGTPTLLSNVVDWLPQTKLHRDLVVGRFDSPEYIAEKILRVSANPEQYSKHVRYMIEHVAKLNNLGAIEVMRQLTE